MADLQTYRVKIVVMNMDVTVFDDTDDAYAEFHVRDDENPIHMLTGKLVDDPRITMDKLVLPMV